MEICTCACSYKPTCVVFFFVVEIKYFGEN